MTVECFHVGPARQAHHHSIHVSIYVSIYVNAVDDGAQLLDQYRYRLGSAHPKSKFNPR